MIAVHDLAVAAGNFSLKHISFEVPTGSYGVLMGKTGSGKTTILECLCGLRPVAAGAIVFNGRDVTNRKPSERDVGYVPQDGALFPTMTVREHLTFALTIRRWSKEDMDRRVAELTELLAIGHLLDRRPQGLSGGEIQRVALGRALAYRPRILCLDEPLTALDDETHEEMCQLLELVRDQTGVTTLHVTHSRREMQRLADCLFLLRNGGIERLPPTAANGKAGG